MDSTKIYIRNMVCNRCIMVITSELAKVGVAPLTVRLGEVTLKEPLSVEQKADFEKSINTLGFSLIDDKRSRLIEQVKTLIIQLVQQEDSRLKTNLSDYIRDHVNYDYNYVSTLFSEVEGTTIEKYFIAQKIEKVKELLVYDELTLSEIAFKLNYSSVAHLSAQFKKVTGLTPKHFKSIKDRKRIPLDKL